MSLNLIIAFERYANSDPILCFERHRLSWQDHGLFDRMKAEAVPLPEGVQWYGDEGITQEQTDPYGDGLKFLPAHSLARHLASAPLRGWDIAVLAFVKALPPSTRCVLWWC